jgi:hypothetical protein
MNYVCGYSPPLINVVRHKIIKKSANYQIILQLFFVLIEIN